MRTLLKAGFIISILLAVFYFIFAIVCFITSQLHEPPANVELVKAGIILIVMFGLSIFGIAISALGKWQLNQKKFSPVIAGVVILSGVVSNLVNIAAGIMMFIAKENIPDEKKKDEEEK